MANTEIDPFAYNPAAADSMFGALPPQAAPQETDISQYLPQAAAQPQPMQGRGSSYDEAFQQAESQYGLPSGLLSTIGFHESRFNPNAVSPAGATGLMQLMPPTAKEYGVDARDPYASINAAGKKMAGLVKYYNGDMAKAVAAYNYGEGNLDKAIRKAGDSWLSATPKETQFYVSKVLGGQQQGAQQGPQEETYDIPLSNGGTLHAPKGMSREEAIAEARAHGLDAVGLRDVPLANGGTLHVPDGMSDEEAVKQASEGDPSIDFTLAKKETADRTTGGFFKDVGATTLKGVTSLAQSVIGLADIITPGDLGAAVENNIVDLSKYQDYLDKQFSPQTQEAIKNLNEAHGLGNILQAAKDNPSAVLSMIGQAAPQMVGAAGPAKAALFGLGKLAGVAPSLAPAIAKYGSYAAAGAGEGAVATGGTKENLRTANPEGEATGTNTIAALGTGAGTALFGGAGAKLTTALGGVDPTIFFMGGKQAAINAVGDIANTPGFFKSTLVSMVGEGVLEEAPQSAVEQVFQNYAEGKTGEGLLEGVPDSAFKGALIGAVMGGGINVGSRIAQPAVQPPPPPPPPPAGQEPPIAGEVPEVPVTPVKEPLFTAEDEALLAASEAKGKKGKAAVVPPVVAEVVPVIRAKPEKVTPTQPTWLTETLGLPKSSSVYKQIATQGLDINKPEDRAAIDKILEPLESNEKITPANWEALNTRMAQVQQGQPITTPIQEAPNAIKIPETTTLDVSSSTQPKVRQKGKSAPISSEGVREGGPESGQVEAVTEEKVAPSIVAEAPRPEPISKEAFNKLSEEEQNKHLGNRYNEGYGGQFTIGDKVISEEHGPGVIKTGGGRSKWVVNFDSGVEVNVPDNTLDIKEEKIGTEAPKEKVKEAPAVSSIMVDAAKLVLKDYKEKPISKNIGRLRTFAEALELPVTVDTPHAEVYDLVAKAITPARDMGRGIQINANKQGIDSVINKAAKQDEVVDEGLQARWIQHAKEGTLRNAEDDVTDFHYDLKTSNPDAHAKAEQANTQAIKAVEDIKTIAAEEREATAAKLEREAKAVNLETIKGVVEAKASTPFSTEKVDGAVVEKPYVDAVKIEMYDKAIDKADEISLGDKKSSAKPLILKLIDQGLLTKEHLVNYENIYKDKDMGLEDIMSEVRADLEMGRETAASTPIDQPTKLLGLGEAKQTEGVTTTPITEAAITATIQEANLNPEDDNYLSEQGDDFSGYESLSDQEAIVSKAIDRTIKKEKAEELKVFDVPEKRVQLLAARKKAHALLDTGKITPDEFIRRSEQITDEERVRLAESKYKRNPRARGANYVREKLLNALRKGDVSQEAHDFAEWFIKKNPDALDNLGISIKEAPEGSRAAGQYTPLNQVITLFKGQEKNTTAVHEMLHHLERAMPEHLQKGIRKAWLKQTIAAKEKAIKNKADKPILDFYTAVLSGDPKAAREALNNVKKDKLDMYHHLNPSEFWAVNATDVMHGKYGADAHFIAKLKQWLKEAHEHIKHVLGLNSKAPILKAINHVLTSIETDYTSKEMLAENIKDTLYNAPPSGPSQAAKDLGKVVADANLVKTSDKKPLDSVKEGVESVIKHSTLTRLRKSWIDASAGLSKALSSLPSMNPKGELRADLLHSKNQQLYNLVRTSFEKGYLVLSEDGGLMSTDDSELALNNIFKRIDELGYPDSRKTFFTAMRVMAGESNLLHDAHQRGLAQRYEKYVKLRKKEIETLTGKERTKLINKLNGLKAEAKRIYERAGKKSLTDMQDEITTKTALAQKKEALAAATADPITKAKLTDAAAKLREAIDKLSEKTESGGVGTEKRVDAQHILDTKKLLASDDRLELIMADIYAALHKSVDLWQQTGLIDSDTANNWRENPAYIPLYKSVEDLLEDPSKYVQVLKSGAKALGKVHAREGGLHDVNVGENLVKHFAFMAGAAAQNQYRKIASYQLASVGGAKISGPDDPQATKFKEDGKDIYYRIEDPVAFEAFQVAIPVLGAFSKVAQQYTKVFRGVTLINPVYWYRQLIRDPMMANLVSQTGFITPLHSLKAMAEILTNRSKSYETLKRHGVVGAVDSLTDPAQFVKAAATKRGTGRKFKDWIMHVHESSDAATRVAVYDKALKDAAKRGMVGEHAENYAVMRSREIINFSKKGNSQSLAAIRATVPFFSAQLNGMDTLARAAMPGTYGNLNKAEAAQARKHFYTNAAILTTISMSYALAMQDDEEYKKSPDWVNSWLVPTGDKDKPFFKIPIPFEAGFFFKVIPELIVRLNSGTMSQAQAEKELGKAFIGLLAPSFPLPQILKPMAEVATNYDIHTGNTIENFSESMLPMEQRSAHASNLSKLLGDYLPISPDNVEHLGRGWFTEAWAMSAALSDAYLNKGVSAPEKEWGEMPMLKGVFTAPGKDRALSEYYDASKSATQIRNAIMAANRVGDRETVDAIKSDPDKLKQFKASSVLQDMGTSISAMQHNIKRIKAMKDTEITPEEKTKRIRVVQDRINKLAQKALVVGKRFGLDL